MVRELIKGKLRSNDKISIDLRRTRARCVREADKMLGKGSKMRNLILEIKRNGEQAGASCANIFSSHLNPT